MVAVSREEPGIEPDDMMLVDPELIRKFGHYHLDPSKYAQFRFPAEPAGRHIIVRRVKNSKGATKTVIDYAPWWEMFSADKRKLIHKARAEQDPAKFKSLLAKLGITDTTDPEQRRQAVMLGLHDRLDGWIDEPPSPPKPPTPPPPPPAAPLDSEPGPAMGRPVSASIEPGSGMKTMAKEMAHVVDSVHGDGELHSLPVNRSKAVTRLGGYRFYRGGRGISITVSSTGDHQELTLLHEIGHFLDHRGIGKPGVWSSMADEPLMADWRAVVAKTDGIRRLKEARETMQPVKDALGRSITLSRRQLDYLLGYEEIWARAYSQYIATRSQNRVLLEQVERIRQTGVYDQMWTDEDFAPVALAIDRLFEELGWRRKIG